MAKVNKNRLLVEGDVDKRVIPELIEANGIPWGKTKEDRPVEIEPFNGIENLKKEVISTELKARGLSALGLIVDADEEPVARWQSVQDVCRPSIPSFPNDIPETGLIISTTSGVKFGVWMMPDNKMRGMLETFLAYLVPMGTEPLWVYAQEAVAEARTRGAPFIDNHTDKANIYTWLAWQNEPGRQLHNAVMERILDPNHPKAQTFVTWFKSLYDL